MSEQTPHLHLPLPLAEEYPYQSIQKFREALGVLDKDASRQDTAVEKLADEMIEALADKADLETVIMDLDGKADKNSLATTDATLAAHRSKAATIEAVGHIRLATDAEATSGTVTTKAVTPKQLKAARDAGASPTRNDTAASYTSAGTGSSATGFKLADGSDIAEIFGKLDNVENAASGTGSFVSDVSLAVNGKVVQLNKKMATPGHCSYCSYCSHCSHCSYCSSSNCACCNG